MILFELNPKILQFEKKIIPYRDGYSQGLQEVSPRTQNQKTHRVLIRCFYEFGETNMPSKDTIAFRITKKTAEELEKIRDAISKELGIAKEFITKKQAEIVLRVKASKGKILRAELNDIMIGKIK